MALSYANILDRTEETLQDSSNATYSTAELGTIIEDELKRISRYQPLFVDVIFQVESRFGTDATGTASKLTDTGKAQFLAADATNEKVVHNTTDDTWAVVTVQDSTSVLSLSRDIMDSGETYEIYNKRCRNKRQIFIGDMPSEYWDKVVSVEYPIGQERNFKKLGEVIELDVFDATIRDSDSTLTIPNQVDVLVRFAVPHILSQLTDWAGELTANESAGDTTIAIDGLGSTEVIEVGEQFTLENHRSTYIVTTALTLSSGAGNLSFYPPLEAALTDNDDINFRKSTLTPTLEEVLCQRVAARAAISKGIKLLQQLNLAITTLASADLAIADMRGRIAQAMQDVTSGRTEADKIPALVTTSAAAVIAKVDAQITKALMDLDLGRPEIDKINIGGDVSSKYAQYANGDIRHAQAYLTEAQGYIGQANANERSADTYALLATRELAQCTQYLNQASGYLREVATRIQLASAFRITQEAGDRVLMETERTLKSSVRSLPFKTLPRT